MQWDSGWVTLLGYGNGRWRCLGSVPRGFITKLVPMFLLFIRVQGKLVLTVILAEITHIKYHQDHEDSHSHRGLFNMYTDTTGYFTIGLRWKSTCIIKNGKSDTIKPNESMLGNLLWSHTCTYVSLHLRESHPGCGGYARRGGCIHVYEYHFI